MSPILARLVRCRGIGIGSIAGVFLLLAACAPAPNPGWRGAGPAASPVALTAPAGPTLGSLTALEAIRRAEAARLALGRENWLITAEARPAAPGGRLGASHEWLLLYRQLDGPLIRITVEASGRVSTGELPGGNWEGGRADRFRVDPASIAHDSHWAIRLADAAGGSAFLSRYPGTRRLIVLDHALGEPLTWTVEYQTPDLYYALTFILEDATGRILHQATCDYSPAAMARPGLPNCERDFEAKDPPIVPPLEPSPEWEIS